MNFDVVIIGAGPSGLACALILGSATNHFPVSKDKKILILDNNKSEILKAELSNVLGVGFETPGAELLTNGKMQISEYENIEIIECDVKKVLQNKDTFLIVATDKLKNKLLEVNAKNLVFACGMKGFDIDVEAVNSIELVQNSKTIKPNRFEIVNEDLKVSENLWVCGTLAGVSSQYMITTGSGAQVGVNILSQWVGNWKVVHDTPRV